mgnify:CR=1 FL=1
MLKKIADTFVLIVKTMAKAGEYEARAYEVASRNPASTAK